MLLLFSFSSAAVVEGVPPGDVEFVIEVTAGLPDDDKLGLLLVMLLFPLLSLGVLLVAHTDDEEELLSLLLVDVVTMELVEEDKDDMEPTTGVGGGKMFGLTGYL